MWKFILFAAFSLLWAFKVSEGFDDLQKKHNTGCNSSLKANTSGLSLNLHNLSQPCYWNITSPGKRIHLFFLKVFLHESDKLLLYKNWTDAESDTDPLIQKPIPSQNGTITIITDEPEIVIKLVGGGDVSYQRTFEGQYSTDACLLPVPPEVEILYSPTYLSATTAEEEECIYRFNAIPHLRVNQAFTFEEFSMTSSSVKIDGGTFSGEYTKDTNTDFFMDTNENVLFINVKQKQNSSDHFRLKIHHVDSDCSGRFEFQDQTKSFTSPPNELNNGSLLYECRWLIQHAPFRNLNQQEILGIKFDTIDFQSVFDIVAVNDGSSENSTPLLQVTTSNKNVTHNQIIRGSGSSLWVAFKPLNYQSSLKFHITVHDQGGYFKDSGDITMTSTARDDTVFLLEVDINEVVMLTFKESSITAPATVSVYDGFDTNNLLTSLRGTVDYPIISKSSRMMITGSNFSAKSNHFIAHFKGVIPSCNHTSSLSTENYILSEGYCNSTCVWVIPPQINPNSALVVYLQYISLKVGDILKIHKLDASLTLLAEIRENVTHVPHFAVPAEVGVLINVTQSECKEKTDKIVLIGHSSYIPACNHDIAGNSLKEFQISSPLYPDTYPVFTTCQWNLTSASKSVVHVAFQNLNLAKNHCVKFSSGSEKPIQFEGKTLPDDLFFSGNVLVGFDSLGCNKSEIGNTLNSDSGFLLNVTVTDCGAVLNAKSGEFNTSCCSQHNAENVCIWKVSVPTTASNPKIISYVVNKKSYTENYELHVYDGSTVRDSKIENNTVVGIWSRTNSLIFVYKRLNESGSSSILSVKYESVSCTAKCDNGICMHPDWKCNGKNECGDYTDERNCNSVPIPPETKDTGYSSTAFWSSIIILFALGIALGIAFPFAYRRFKDSRYRRFHELDSS